MLVQHKHVGNKGMFFIQDEGNILAELVYSQPAPDKMIIEHTEVTEELQGRNIGYELVHHSVEHARSHHLQVIPLCPFAKAVIDKKPEFQDVLAS